MDRGTYEAETCQRLPQAESIPFRQVSSDGWEPTIANCHNNVDEWVRRNPSYSAVRGWVTNGSFGFALQLTAHSVVRDADNMIFDITPVYDEEHRGQSVRRGMQFVEHLGTDVEFFAYTREGHTMCCPLPSSEFPELDA